MCIREATNTNRHLYIFNIAFDQGNYALAANSDIIKMLSAEFTYVHVITRFWDQAKIRSNVQVTEISGGSFFSRARGAVELLGIIKEILEIGTNAIVLFHMNDRFAAVVAPWLRLNKLKSTLWYSHAKASLSLRWTNKFVSNIVTTAPDAYPLKHKNIYAIGQLVSSNNFRFSTTEEVGVREDQAILSVGRIAKVKFLEDLINGIIPEHQIKAIRLIGPLDLEKESDYVMEIRELAKSKNLEVMHDGPRPRMELHTLYSQYSMIFSGTQKAIDKSAIEGAFCGMFVISTNRTLLQLTGMVDLFKQWNIRGIPGISEQIGLIRAMSDPDELIENRRLIAQTSMMNCGLENKIKEFVSIISH